MKGGFSFCNVDIADLNLEYAPELDNTFVYSPSVTDSHFETYDGHNGGYYYGSWTEPKEFTLRCFFENKHINKGVMAKIYDLFKTGRTGKLVFQKRPWCYYIATVNSVPKLDPTNYLNGLVTINMTATYPFARSDIQCPEKKNKFRENMLANTGAYEKQDMILDTKFENNTEAFSVLLGNIGTERAPLGVYVDGYAPGGLQITNRTTGQVMRLTEFTKAVTTDIQKRIYIDSLNGKTMLKSEDSSEIAFIFHESGYLELEPGYPVHRNIYINYGVSDVITTKGFYPDDITGQYIFAKGWHKIVEQPDRHTVIVDDSVSENGVERTQIMTLNELYIEPIDISTPADFNIEFVFKPTFA